MMVESSESGRTLVLVLSTLPSREAAEQLVRQLVEERLIACGNLLPGITSIFRWDAKVQREEEVLVVMKTSRGAVERLFQRVSELHPYEVPEVVSLAADAAAAAYGRWVNEETSEVTA